MIAEEIRASMRSTPFRPFRVHLADGTHVVIHHHDYAWLQPSGFQIHVQSPQGRIDLINLSQVTRVSYREKSEPANPTGGERR